MKRPREIPDAQIKDAADQYADAALILLGMPPGSGVLLPGLTCAAFSIELYLKSLMADQDYHPIGDGASLVTAKSVYEHRLAELLKKLDPGIRAEIEMSFQASKLSSTFPTIEDALHKYTTLFVDSRYAFEGSNIKDIGLDNLRALVEFMQDFVDRLLPNHSS